MKDSFVLLRSMVNAIRKAPIEKQVGLYDALFDYELNGNEPKDYVAKVMIESFKHLKKFEEEEYFAKKRRSSYEYKMWRKHVLERDKYICTKCGKTKSKMHAHHVKEFASHPECRYEVANGVTLCVYCHRKTHGWRGYK